MNKLKPCPFCGGTPTIRGIKNEWIENVLFGEDNKGYPQECWWVSCETDHCPAYHMMEYDSKEKCVEAWNKRVSDDYDGFEDTK